MVEKGTSYFSVRDPNHATRDLDRFRDAGLDAVLHTFSERDRLYYKDTVRELIDASHDRDFTVYVAPWGVGRVFGGEALSEFIGRHPESCQRTAEGRRVPSACFNDERFREFVADWVRDAVDVGADVVFWDEPHWYIPDWYDDDVPSEAWTCHCESCSNRYEARYGDSMPARRTERTEDFRETSLLSFLEEMMALVREEGARNAVCLLPGEFADHGVTDWDRLAATPHIDTLATDPYWSLHAETDSADRFVRRYTDLVTDLAGEHDLRSQIWIQGFRLEGDDETVADVRAATREALAGGVDSVFMWGYDGCRSISSIACENPDRIWDAYVDELP